MNKSVVQVPKVFPIDVSEYKSMAIDLSNPELAAGEIRQLETNILLSKKAVVFTTAYSARDGLGGHTGTAFATTVEKNILRAIINGKNNIFPYIFEGSGHGASGHYVDRALEGAMPVDMLLKYRRAGSSLTGHYEPGHGKEPAIAGMAPNATGRLGHCLADVCGYSLANPGLEFLFIGSDGDFYEGNTLESFQLLVSQGLHVNLFINDNNMTIAGAVSEHDPKYDLESVLSHPDVKFDVCADPDDVAKLYKKTRAGILHDGPSVLINQRRNTTTTIVTMPGRIHDAIKAEPAAEYLKAVGEGEAATILLQPGLKAETYKYQGSSPERKSIRSQVGTDIGEIVAAKGGDFASKKAILFHNDVPGSSGGKQLIEACPDIKVVSGIRERSNLLAAASYGAAADGNVAVYTIFGAFGGQMILSEKRMAELSNGRALIHISHSGCDGISDNTCHFGDNIGLLANSIREGDKTRIFFPGDPDQATAIVGYDLDLRINGPYCMVGLTFIVDQRSKVPFILKEDGTKFFDPETYTFNPGVPDVIRGGKDGYVVAMGAVALYNALDAVDRQREDGRDIGLINWHTLSRPYDDNTLKLLSNVKFVVTVEDENIDTGLGMRMGTLLAERDEGVPYLTRMGITKRGNGGQDGSTGQLAHQGLDARSIYKRLTEVYQQSN